MSEKGFERDALGQIMSKGQSLYFKNSKLRDPNGHLIVFYHGDKHSDKIYFNCERGPVYFSEVFSYADEYAEDEYGVRGLTYSVYIDMQNPLRQLTPECKNYLEKSGIAEDKKVDLRVGDPISTFLIDDHDMNYRFYEWLKRNTSYDGILVSEGLGKEHMSKYGKKADVAIIPFYSNQIKFTANKNPTYSLNSNQ